MAGQFNKLMPKVFVWGNVNGEPTPGAPLSSLTAPNATFDFTTLVNQMRSIQYSLNPNDNGYNAVRENHIRTVLSTAARTSSPGKASEQVHNARGIIALINVTAITAAPSITLSITNKFGDSAGFTYEILESLAITAVGNYAFRIMPGIREIPNTSVAEPLADYVEFTVTHADADSITYGLTVAFVV